ncbi:hypothetical protein [Streptomyces sp. NPDC089919]|uniref:hypothetical protein n=1 Tax=Streptomyces sp. NPDC089919 TaxID=3155188 RepID=UPI00342C47FE
MSGHDIPPLVLLGALGLTGALAYAAAGRQRGTAAISSGLLAVQGSLHLAFAGTETAPPATGAPPAHHAMRMDMPMDPSMDMSMPMDAGTSMGHPPMGHMAMSAMDMSGHGGMAGMVLAHVLAGVFCALWLARGEAAVFRLARVVALRAFAPVRRAVALVRALAPAAPPRRPRPAAARPRRRLRGALPAHSLVRRGPPVLRAPSTTAPGRCAPA